MTTTFKLNSFDRYYSLPLADLLAEMDRRGIEYYSEVTHFAAIRMLIEHDRVVVRCIYGS